jgi:hypothetical protein
VSWFLYGDQKKRSKRKGIWLRVRNLPEPLLSDVNKFLSTGEQIDYVIVKELQEKNKVLLEFWCHKMFGPDERRIVIQLSVEEDPEWVCEGDLGRGLGDSLDGGAR